jgi:hypothetical protein
MQRALIVCSLALFALPAVAKEKAGVNLAESQTIDGKDVKLNGMGIRKKFFFKVYVAGLYLETPSKDPATIISSDQVKQMDIHMVRDVSKAKFLEALNEGFEKNAHDQMPAFKDRLAKMAAVIPDLKEGQTVIITYVPGKGTHIKGPTGQEVTLEGKDFAEAMFAVWLGKFPADDGLKKDLLGAG